MQDPTSDKPPNVYEAVGGEPFFFELVDRFYAGVESDTPLRKMYPEDLEPGKEALALFLSQYFGGPPTYSETKGHPRLRMRHVNFRIAEPERDAWLRHMTAAVDESVVAAEVKATMHGYFAMAATHMINVEQ